MKTNALEIVSTDMISKLNQHLSSNGRNKKMTIFIMWILLFWGCRNETSNHSGVSHLDIGNKFIDAFYSFNSDSLQSILSSAKQSLPEILNYQKWADCAHYQIVDRSHYFEKNDSVVVFPVTVKDDLMGALEIDFNVTDTFYISVQNGKILAVKTTSNDIELYYKAKEWVIRNRPELVEKPCKDIWAGGPTPCECVLGMIKGFKEYIATQKYSE